MNLYRISSRRFPPFDGTGASINGARWNTPDRFILYCGENLSVCRLETMVHIEPSCALPPHSHHYVEIDVPDAIWDARRILKSPPPGWDHPTHLDIAQEIGDDWYDSGKSLILKVPSVAAKGDFVVMINQMHPEFSQLTASAPKPLDWDARLLKRFQTGRA